MSNSVFHTFRELKLLVRVFLVFSVFKYARVDAFKNLEETMHVQVGRLHFRFIEISFQIFSSKKFPNPGCGLSTGVYGNLQL